MSVSRPIIMVVEDEEAVRASYDVTLGDDYDLLMAETGGKALEILNRRRDINLVLLDYLLPPGIDGLEVLKRMKEIGCKVPVIIVTGKGSEKICREAFRLGVDDYIIKPFKVEELRATVKKVLGPLGSEKPPLDKAMDFVREYYCQTISARDVAQGTGFSLSHLEHMFKRELGCSITEYIHSLRIERSKHLLMNRDTRIKEVASSIGLKDPDYFCRIFKRSVGCTPTVYRERFR